MGFFDSVTDTLFGGGDDSSSDRVRRSDLESIFGGPELSGEIFERAFGGTVDGLSAGTALREFLRKRVKRTPAEVQSLGFFNNLLQSDEFQELPGFLEELRDSNLELIETGLPVDFEPIIRDSLRRNFFERNPEALENLPALGGGQTAGLLASQNRSLESDLFAQIVPYLENAERRRTEAILNPQSARNIASPVTLPSEIAAFTGQQGELGRIRKEATRPGAGPPIPSFLSDPAFSNLLQGEISQQFLAPPIGLQNSGSQGGGLLGALLGTETGTQGLFDLGSKAASGITDLFSVFGGSAPASGGSTTGLAVPGGVFGGPIF